MDELLKLLVVLPVLFGVITSVSNLYNVRTASRDQLGLYGVPAPYKRIREHIWELTCDSADNDGGAFGAAAEITITEEAVIVGISIKVDQEFLTDPGATDHEISTNAVAMIGVTGGNSELAELGLTNKEYAIGVVTGMHRAKWTDHMRNFGIRWPIMDGDIFRPMLSVFNDTAGTPTGVRHYGEIRFYVIEKK